MTRKTTWVILSKVSALLGAIVLLAVGCASQPSTGGAEPPRARGYAQVWADNCVRCHNTRSPSSYSDERWEVSMLHMRVRANLTAQDYRTILEFVKASN